MKVCLYTNGRTGQVDLQSTLLSIGCGVLPVKAPGERLDAHPEVAVVALPADHGKAEELLRQFRAALPRGLPILALGHWENPADVAALLKAGAADYLAHPWQTRDLALRLRILRHDTPWYTQDLQNRLAGTQRIETLSTMAGSLAHDFNNLLTAILGNAEVAQLDPNLGDSARYCLTQIERASRHAAELTRQMMVFAGRAAPAALPVALDELVGEMAEILRASISQTSRLEFEMEPGLPLVLGEPSQLRQVVMNLLINASEAMSARGGVIRVTGHRSQRHGEQRVVIEVSDTGAGIAPDVQRRIFDPFYSTKRQGRGLGLAAVRSIVESHGGEVSVESLPGQGTTFRLSFPAHTGTPHNRVTRISSLVTGASGAILLVEDESSLRDAAVRLLSRTGFQVLPAANVDEAVALFRHHADELRAVVADLLLQNASGEELLRTLHSLRSDLPILIWTACDEEEVRARTAGVPVAMILHKPRPLRDLAAAISRTLADSSGAVA